jgi:hypothetical protein
VLEKALKALDEREEELSEELEDTRAKVQEGTDQLKRGDYIECTEKTLDAVLEEIESEALRDVKIEKV